MLRVFALLLAGQTLPVDPEIAAINAERVAEQQAEADRLEALKRERGKNYMRLRVGMAWKVARRCTAMNWAVYAEDQRGIVYEAEGGFVRVEKGIVVKWVAPR